MKMLKKLKPKENPVFYPGVRSIKRLEEEGKEKHAKIDQSLRNLKLTIEGKDWEIRFKNEVLTTLDHHGYKTLYAYSKHR